MYTPKIKDRRAWMWTVIIFLLSFIFFVSFSSGIGWFSRIASLFYDVALRITYLLTDTDFYLNLLITLRRILIATIISLILGLLIVIIKIRIEWLRGFIRMIVYLALAVPAIVFIYLALITFGFKELTVLVILVALMIPQMVTIIDSGFSSINKEIFKVADIYRVHGLRRIRNFLLPQLTPSLSAGVISGISIGSKVSVLTETFITGSGIGYRIYYYFQIFSIVNVLAWSITYIILLVMIYWLINFITGRNHLVRTTYEDSF